jgi:hypothetical protein
MQGDSRTLSEFSGANAAGARTLGHMRNRRPIFLVVAFVILAIVVALPALAADPSPSPGPGKSDKAKESKAPKTEVTLTGTLATSTDAEGKTSYTLQSGGTTYTLDAGPPWFYGDKHPLKAFAGKIVTVVGEHATGSTEVDVRSVNGTTIRSPGKPPWAGGWKRVGSAHPGWSQEKADRMKAKFGDCFPPGQCKTKAKPNKTTPNASPTP